LLHRLRLDLAPGQLCLGQVVPAGQVERLERTLQRRSPVLLGAKNRPDYLKLFVAEPDDPHRGLLGDPGDFRQARALNGRKPKTPATRGLRVAPRRIKRVAPGGAPPHHAVREWIRTASILFSRTDSTLISYPLALIRSPRFGRRPSSPKT